MAPQKIRTFFVLLFVLSFFNSTIKPWHTKTPSSPVFSEKRRGLIKLLRQIDIKGNEFEIASALKLAYDGERIVGFDLDINFKDGCVTVVIDREMHQLHTTEFDIVSSNYVVECKSSKNPSINCDIAQFTKEQTMLRWLNAVMRDLDKRKLSINSYISKRSNKPFIVLNGPCTNYKDIDFTSTWFTAENEDECIDQFISIIEILVDKDVRVMFQGLLTAEFGNELYEQGLPFEEGIHLPFELSKFIDPSFLTQKDQMNRLNGLFENLTIDTNPGEDMQL